MDDIITADTRYENKPSLTKMFQRYRAIKCDFVFALNLIDWIDLMKLPLILQILGFWQ